MTPIDGPDHRAASLGQGSGDLELEAAITKLRAAMLRAINELDLFTESVKQARTRIEAVSAAHAEPRNNN